VRAAAIEVAAVVIGTVATLLMFGVLLALASGSGGLVDLSLAFAAALVAGTVAHLKEGGQD
jgi:hypothetical protein